MSIQNQDMTDFQRFIYKSRYARWRDEDNRREEWDETVDRYMLNVIGTKIDVNSAEAMEIRQAIYNMDVMPSMRALMTAGRALDRDNVAGYNCSFVAVDDVRSFDEILYILMCGTGVGFSVERKHVDQLPLVAEEFHGTDTTIIVADSRIGWASSLRELIALLYSGKVPAWNLERVREAGARLKTFGGRSSGPAPLNRLFEYAVALFKKAAGRKLYPIECHDLICQIADAVVVGGVRRSALISLSNLSDERLARAKSGAWWVDNSQRALANNSVAYTEKPDIESFLKEWSALYESKSGERGIFNRVAAKKQAKNTGRREYDGYDFGVNPCLTGDTLIATLDGPKSFKELADSGEDVLVYAWNPRNKKPVVRWMRNPRKTGTKKTKIITFDSGLKLKATENHSLYSFRGDKVKVKNLTVGQSIRAFTLNKHRDGHLRVCGWDSKLDRASHQWVARMVWECYNGDIPSGYVIHHNDGNHEHNNIGNLRLMTITEHLEEHYPGRLDNGFYNFHKEKEESWLLRKEKIANHKVVSIEDGGVENVYNGTVDDVHTYIVCDPEPVSGVMSGIVSANCGEIILRPMSFCNLSEVVVRPSDSLSDIKRKVQIATIIGTIQSTFTNFRYLRKQWQKNAEEERLLGVSLTGIMDHPVMSGKEDMDPYINSHKNFVPLLPDWLAKLKETAIETNKLWAERLGITQSVSITCVKPSGTVSQLVGCSSGIHPAFSQYYIRTVRLDTKDPLCDFLKAEGVPNEPEAHRPNDMVVFSFPCSAGGAVTADEVTAMEQLSLYLMYKKFWCEHNPSITIYYKDEEYLQLGASIYRDFEDIIGLTLLPYSDHSYKQAPYQKITEEQYLELLGTFPKIDWSKFQSFEKEDATTATHELACSSGACDIL